MEDRSNKNNNDIYESLKGYFPEKYDMSPDELERQIETDKKEQGIALGFTDPARSKVATSNAVENTAVSETSVQAQAQAKAEAEAQAVAEAMTETETETETETVAETASEGGAEILLEDKPVESEEFPVLSEYDEEAGNGGTVSERFGEGFDSTDGTETDSEPSLSDCPFRVHLQDSDEDMSESALLDGYDSLDDLFNELETDGGNGNEARQSDGNDDEKARRVIDWFFDFLEVFTVCMACIILFFSFVARLTRVDGDSMNDTLLNGQYLVVSDLFYTPRAGDIVVLQNTSLDTVQLKEPLVKRIIALGGERVHIDSDGKVTVTDRDGNEKELDQSFTKSEPYLKGEMTYTVPEGCVFVMGDNRNNSTDSRDYHVGPVDERCIFGKAYFRVLPFGTATAFKNPYTE